MEGIVYSIAITSNMNEISKWIDREQARNDTHKLSMVINAANQLNVFT